MKYLWIKLVGIIFVVQTIIMNKSLFTAAEASMESYGLLPMSSTHGIYLNLSKIFQRFQRYRVVPWFGRLGGLCLGPLPFSTNNLMVAFKLLRAKIFLSRTDFSFSSVLKKYASKWVKGWNIHDVSGVQTK